jgi:hypothetical protein
MILSAMCAAACLKGMRIIAHAFFFHLSRRTEAVEVMEMDSPFSGAMIEGRNSHSLKKGSTITLTCKVMEGGVEANAENARIDWMKNRELVNDKVRRRLTRPFSGLFSFWLGFGYRECNLNMFCPLPRSRDEIFS